MIDNLMTPVRRRILRHTAIMSFSVGVVFAGSSFAEQLDYNPALPQFGGTNIQALAVLQMEKQISDSRAAKEEALQKELDRLEANPQKSASELLVASLTRTLNSQIARRISDDILDGTATEDTFLLGDVTIAYVRDADGGIVVTITDVEGDDTIVSFPGTNTP